MERYIEYRWRYVKYDCVISSKLASVWSEWIRCTSSDGTFLFPSLTTELGYRVEYQARIREGDDDAR